MDRSSAPGPRTIMTILMPVSADSFICGFPDL